jgi:hypothetical protein
MPELILGQSPTKTDIPIQVDVNGNLIVGSGLTQIVNANSVAITSQNAASKNAMHVALLASGNTEINSLGTVSGAIGPNASPNALSVRNFGLVFNGTNWVEENARQSTLVKNGRNLVTTAGTRVQLASSTVLNTITIKALTTNVGVIYVGDSTVSSTNGYQLSAKETVTIAVTNANLVYLDASISGEGVTWIIN